MKLCQKKLCGLELLLPVLEVVRFTLKHVLDSAEQTASLLQMVELALMLTLWQRGCGRAGVDRVLCSSSRSIVIRIGWHAKVLRQLPDLLVVRANTNSERSETIDPWTTTLLGNSRITLGLLILASRRSGLALTTRLSVGSLCVALYAESTIRGSTILIASSTRTCDRTPACWAHLLSL
jgi:hypothetical protein